MGHFFIKHMFFPLYEGVRRWETVKCLRELEKTQWYSSDQIKEYKWNKLKSLLTHAYNNVPYYKNLFKYLDIIPEDIRSFDDFRQIPCTTKKEMRLNLRDFISKDAVKRGLIKMNTGGSSGDPLIFYVDRRRIAYDRASHIRARKWWGIDIGDKEIVLWGSPIELKAQDKLKNLRDWLFNTKLLSAFKTSEEKMVEYAEVIKKFRPKHLFGYSSSIYLFCKTMMKKGIDLKDVGIKVIFVTADMLYDHQREVIENFFDCPVANGYGSRDGGFIAHECPEGGMHITENIYVEFLKGNIMANPEEKAEVVVTHLDNYTMPFIRYRTGDIATYTEDRCPCGRGLDLIQSIEGRSTDFIITPGGKIMHALSIIYILRDIAGIDLFKVIQKRKDFLIVQIVKNHLYSNRHEEFISKEINKVMEDRIEVSFEYVTDIPYESSGKFRYVISEVSNG